MLNLTYPFSLSSRWKDTDRFWCSALVSYIYYRLGWISDVNWGLIAPRELSQENTGQVVFTCEIEEEKEFSVLTS